MVNFIGQGDRAGKKNLRVIEIIYGYSEATFMYNSIERHAWQSEIDNDCTMYTQQRKFYSNFTQKNAFAEFADDSESTNPSEW